MLSGDSSGGQLGLVLGAALFGTAAATLAMKGPGPVLGAVGLGVVGLFALLVTGYFSDLETSHAVVLFCAPLLAFLPELPWVRRMGPLLRGMARVGFVATPVVVVALLAYQQHEKDSAQPSSGSQDRSTENSAAW
jgi:hypothetical protein